MEKTIQQLRDLPDFLQLEDLIDLGIFENSNGAYLARIRKIGPPYTKLGRKILYPKAELIAFLQSNFSECNRR